MKFLTISLLWSSVLESTTQQTTLPIKYLRGSGTIKNIEDQTTNSSTSPSTKYLRGSGTVRNLEDQKTNSSTSMPTKLPTSQPTQAPSLLPTPTTIGNDAKELMKNFVAIYNPANKSFPADKLYGCNCASTQGFCLQRISEYFCFIPPKNNHRIYDHEKAIAARIDSKNGHSYTPLIVRNLQLGDPDLTSNQALAIDPVPYWSNGVMLACNDQLCGRENINKSTHLVYMKTKKAWEVYAKSRYLEEIILNLKGSFSPPEKTDKFLKKPFSTIEIVGISLGSAAITLFLFCCRKDIRYCLGDIHKCYVRYSNEKKSKEEAKKIILEMKNKQIEAKPFTEEDFNTLRLIKKYLKPKDQLQIPPNLVDKKELTSTVDALTYKKDFIEHVVIFLNTLIKLREVLQDILKYKFSNLQMIKIIQAKDIFILKEFNNIFATNNKGQLLDMQEQSSYLGVEEQKGDILNPYHDNQKAQLIYSDPTISQQKNKLNELIASTKNVLKPFPTIQELQELKQKSEKIQQLNADIKKLTTTDNQYDFKDIDTLIDQLDELHRLKIDYSIFLKSFELQQLTHEHQNTLQFIEQTYLHNIKKSWETINNFNFQSPITDTITTACYTLMCCIKNLDKKDTSAELKELITICELLQQDLEKTEQNEKHYKLLIRLSKKPSSKGELFKFCFICTLLSMCQSIKLDLTDITNLTYEKIQKKPTDSYKEIVDLCDQTILKVLKDHVNEKIANILAKLEPEPKLIIGNTQLLPESISSSIQTFSDQCQSVDDDIKLFKQLIEITQKDIDDLIKKLESKKQTTFGAEIIKPDEATLRLIENETGIDISTCIESESKFTMGMFENTILCFYKNLNSTANVEQLKELLTQANKFEKLSKDNLETLESVASNFSIYSICEKNQLTKVNIYTLNLNKILGYFPAPLQFLLKHLQSVELNFSKFKCNKQLTFIYESLQRLYSKIPETTTEHYFEYENFKMMLTLIKMGCGFNENKKQAMTGNQLFKSNEQNKFIKDNINKLSRFFYLNEQLNFKKDFLAHLNDKSATYCINMVYICGQLAKSDVLGYHLDGKNQANELFYMMFIDGIIHLNDVVFKDPKSSVTIEYNQRPYKIVRNIHSLHTKFTTTLDPFDCISSLSGNWYPHPKVYGFLKNT